MTPAEPRAPAGRAPELAAVFAGGAAGALVRVALAESWTAGTFPWATLVANVVGCALLGLVLARTAEGSAARGLLGPGLCGGLTTFSTFQVELVELLRDGHAAAAASSAALSLAAGLLAFAVARRLAP